MCADISSETKVHMRAVCKPLRLGYIYLPPMLVRVRESAIADYAPPTIIVEERSLSVHTQALTRAHSDANGREMVTVHMAKTQRTCLRDAKVPLLCHATASGAPSNA